LLGYGLTAVDLYLALLRLVLMRIRNIFPYPDHFPKTAFGFWVPSNPLNLRLVEKSHHSKPWIFHPFLGKKGEEQKV
jgi:hypothetical protein